MNPSHGLRLLVFLDSTLLNVCVDVRNHVLQFGVVRRGQLVVGTEIVADLLVHQLGQHELPCNRSLTVGNAVNAAALFHDVAGFHCVGIRNPFPKGFLVLFGNIVVVQICHENNVETIETHKNESSYLSIQLYGVGAPCLPSCLLH